MEWMLLSRLPVIRWSYCLLFSCSCLRYTDDRGLWRFDWYYTVLHYLIYLHTITVLPLTTVYFGSEVHCVSNILLHTHNYTENSHITMITEQVKKSWCSGKAVRTEYVYISQRTCSYYGHFHLVQWSVLLTEYTHITLCPFVMN